MDINVQKINKISGDLIRAQSRYDKYKSIIEYVEKGGKLTGKLDFQSGGDRRTAMIEWLDTDDILPAIQTRLKDAEAELETCKSVFKNL